MSVLIMQDKMLLYGGVGGQRGLQLGAVRCKVYNTSLSPFVCAILLIAALGYAWMIYKVKHETE